MTSQIIEKALTDPDTIIQLATNLKEERKQKELLKEKLKIQEHVIKESAPKVEYYENVLQSESLISTNIIAKDMGMSAPSLNRLLKRLGVIYRSGKTWVLYHRFQSFGYTGTRTFDYIDKNGVKQTAIHTYWTEKGREFVIGQVKIWDEKYKRAIGGR
jgi:phage antirepressor YoqD-like protein